jgi:hypothetical protein
MWVRVPRRRITFSRRILKGEWAALEFPDTQTVRLRAVRAANFHITPDNRCDAG